MYVLVVNYRSVIYSGNQIRKCTYVNCVYNSGQHESSQGVN